MAEGNKSLPYGIVHTVRACFRRLGLYGFLDGLKDKGVPLSFVIELMCVYQLNGGSSMNECGVLSDSVLVRDELCHGHRITRKTIERSLSLLDLYFEETIVHLWNRLNEIYPDMSTDVYVDGSHIPREGSGTGAYTAAGEGGGTVQLQDQFMVSQLVESGLPVSVEVYRGNLNDPPQYADFVPQLMFLLKKGSMIIMDHGGSAKDLLHEIKDGEMDYLTRVRMNNSDIERIRNEIERAEYVGNGTMCIHHRFESSDRHTYLYFSVDRYIMGHLSAERKALRMMQMARDAKDFTENPDPRKVVKTVKNPFIKVKSVKVEVEMTLNPWLEEDVAKAIRETEKDDCGWFKLECSKGLTPLQALDLYRHRSGIEALISSLKSVVNLKPLRVWSASSTRGAVLLGLIAQLCISMVRYDMEPDTVEKRVDGKVVRIGHKPSTATICKNLCHWTVVLIPRDGFRVERIFTDENDLTRRISAVLERYQGCFDGLSRAVGPWKAV